MFKLVIQDDEGKTTVVPLIRDEITIGRKEGNTIRLTERNVSRRHARIVRMNGTVAIEDLGSYNGVRVNGTRIAQRTALTISDRVQIGDYLIELKAEGAEVGPADDGKTQPIERMDPAMLARGGMPTPVMTGNPHATMVALADTDPNQRASNIAAAAGAPMPAAMPAPSGFARLVILSSNFAGQEFELTKPQMIVGRTDDNDIVVNHRSISRNHAKVVREPDTGRYTISDLASSNGVRVNGEEYGKVELRRGDTIDLGHVRMRFVEPGEDFVFGRDAQAVDVPTGGSKKGLIIGLVALLAIGGIVIAVTAGGGGSKSSDGGSGSGTASGSVAAGGTGSSSGVATGTAAGTGDSSGSAGSATASAAGGTGSATGSAPAIVADAATQETGSAGSGTAAGTGAGTAEGTGAGTGGTSMAGGDAAKKAEECKGYRDQGDWTDLATCATDLGKLDPTNPDAKAFGDTARNELRNKMALDDLAGLINKRDWGAAKQACDKVDDASVYKDKLHQLCDKAKSDFIADMVGRARSAASHHQCKDVVKLGQQSGRIWPEAKEAVDGVSCTEQVASNPGSGSNTHPGSGSATPPGGSNTAPAGGCSDVAQVLDDARAAAKNTQWGKALRLCEQAMACNKGDSEVVMVCALAACNIKNLAKAKLYISKLSPTRQSLARQSCLRNGLDPGGG